MGKIIIISDLHIGDKTKSDDFYTHGSLEPFLEFLNWVKLQDDIKEMVFAGDVFELWQSSISRTFQSYPEIWKKLYEIKDSGKKMIYVPGNHDSLPFTRFSIDEIPFDVGPLQVTPHCILDETKDLAFSYYVPEVAPNLWIEHGHRFDESCESATTISGKNKLMNILSRFFTWITGVFEKSWDTIDEVILSKINFFKKDEYKEILKRLKSFKSPTSKRYKGDLTEYFDRAFEMSSKLKTDNRKIIIIGHTHRATIKKDDSKNLTYVNTGSWVTKKKTFVVYNLKTKEVELYSWEKGPKKVI